MTKLIGTMRHTTRPLAPYNDSRYPVFQSFEHDFGEEAGSEDFPENLTIYCSSSSEPEFREMEQRQTRLTASEIERTWSSLAELHEGLDLSRFTDADDDDSYSDTSEDLALHSESSYPSPPESVREERAYLHQDGTTAPRDLVDQLLDAPQRSPSMGSSMNPKPESGPKAVHQPGLPPYRPKEKRNHLGGSK
ncbi:hypothetical protein C8R41DRAFT_926407 [Lentinula lateritia]|uniref:Uncharacterized protein n=1 Tax=Lentinula lateritia TaxID=40482 RepID=A0ABQ8UY95_9AGAR|nr:hypothetical protein C8R41DRAFT_926407 [Lentinula lateritia]